jgi:hypothetical protein
MQSDNTVVISKVPDTVIVVSLHISGNFQGFICRVPEYYRASLYSMIGWITSA